MGGWNYNCFPNAYTRYSVGGYGTTTPNYWKIDQYGGGDVNSCVESNQVWNGMECNCDFSCDRSHDFVYFEISNV